MIRFKLSYLQPLAALLLSVFAACSDDNTSSLRLDGDTMIEAITFDQQYEGTVDPTAATITVRVPAAYDVSAMTLTKLSLSEGATSTVPVGTLMDLSVPRSLRVVSGDVSMAYTVKAVRDDARILSFRLNDKYIGVVNQEALTITVRVPSSADVKSMAVTLTTNEGAEVSPASGSLVDFSQPVNFTVSYGTSTNVYRVTVVQSDAPEALFVGLGATLDDLCPEERAAADWMLGNVAGSQYASMADIAAGRIDTGKCRVIWWHYHIDGGIDNMEKFDAAAPDALSAVAKIRDLYQRGVGIVLTRFATYYAAKLGATRDERNPNNCWGGRETDAETTGGPWNFFIQGHTDHALFRNLVVNGSETDKVYTCDTGYRITNSTCQWHIGADWGGYASLDEWRDNHGGQDLGYGGDGAVVVWEYPATGGAGRIVCIGSGCYDWYADGMDASADRFHANVETMTANAITYVQSSK